MPARERRTIHVTLASFPTVKTYSIGRGDQRRVVIEPTQI
ncbi:MAG: R3H domain-containing nucleic acid-binding protein [Candidatus Bipolaricaulota bacterium]